MPERQPPRKSGLPQAAAPLPSTYQLESTLESPLTESAGLVPPLDQGEVRWGLPEFGEELFKHAIEIR